MAKYYFTVPSLCQRNAYLERKIKVLKDMNAALKIQVAQLLNSKNPHNLEENPFSTQRKTEVYLYFSYKQQIKEKLDQIKELEEKCSKLFFEATTRKSDEQAVDSQEENVEANKNESLIGEKGIMRQQHSARVQQNQNDDEQQINGRKMSKKQSLQQKKEQKKVLQQSKQTIPEIRILNEMMDDQIEGQKQNKKRSIVQYINQISRQQKITSQKLLPSVQFLKKYISPKQIQLRLKKDNSCEKQHQSGKVNCRSHMLRLKNTIINIKEFIKYDWKQLEFLSFNNCGLKSEDWDILCENSHLFRGLISLNLQSNKIKDVNADQLTKFSFLQFLTFGQQLSKKLNPLSKQSLKEIQKWISLNEYNRIRIIYPQKQNEQIPQPIQSDHQQTEIELTFIPPPPPKVLKQTECINYLNSEFPHKVNEMKSVYGPHSDKRKASQFKNKGITYSQNSFYLIHNFKIPTMSKFTKLNWQEFEQIRICNCQLTDNDWQTFSLNSQQYPHLKMLILSNNSIQEVRFQELQEFKELKYINLEGNKLSERSKCDIEEYKEKHRDVRFYY